MSKAGGEAERRRRARARKAAAAPATAAPMKPWWPEIEAALVDCLDPANHKVCPEGGGEHDWYKPNPRPADHKYECAACGHYDLDDYR